MGPAKVALISGYTGQDGTFLTKLLLDKGYKVVGLVRRVSTEPPRRVRGEFDFSNAISEGRLVLEEGDLLSRSSLDAIIKTHQPDEIYNLAAQSHVGTSFKQPEFTIEVVLMGTVNLIESLKTCHSNKSWRLYQASTSEMFGSQKQNIGYFDESAALEPNSPYAIAKAAAHQYCKMTRREGYFISCGILFNHESEIRGGDFVTQKIASGAVKWHFEYKRFALMPTVLKVGNLEAVRDWGYAGDYVEAMWRMLQIGEPDDFVIGTGESHSVRTFIDKAFEALGHKVDWAGTPGQEKGYVDAVLAVEVSPEFYRPVDVGYLKAKPTKAKAILDWDPKVNFDSLVMIMVSNQVYDQEGRQL
jgi:GDPmannose 4,6-dehydratase